MHSGYTQRKGDKSACSIIKPSTLADVKNEAYHECVPDQCLCDIDCRLADEQWMVQLLEERSCACGSAAVSDEAFHRSLYVKSDVLSSHPSQDSPGTALDKDSGLTTTARTNMTVPVPSNLLLSFERWEYCRRYMRIHIEIAYRTAKMPKRRDSRNKATS